MDDMGPTTTSRKKPKAMKYIEFQDAKNTDWKYEFYFEPSKKWLLLLGLLAFLLLGVSWTSNVVVLEKQYEYFFEKAGIIVFAALVKMKIVPPPPTEPPPTTTTTTTPEITTTISVIGEIIHKKRAKFRVGTAISDMTGPPVSYGFMGYMSDQQMGTGLHTRQFARCFCFTETKKKKLVYVVAELFAVGYTLRHRIIQDLRNYSRREFSIYNVHIQATGTHSTPGCHFPEYMFGMGPMFSEECLRLYSEGITKGIIDACSHLRPGYIFYAKSAVFRAQINRSPAAYENNPIVERKRFPIAYDYDLTQLRVENKYGNVIGVINWFAMTASNVNVTNTLISSDNFGYASIQMEKYLNSVKLVGKGMAVAAFAPSNGGDVSPNIMNGTCTMYGRTCYAYSECPVSTPCIPRGPERDMFHSAANIGYKIFEGAKEVLEERSDELKGSLESTFKLYSSYNASGVLYDPIRGTFTENQFELCSPWIGQKFTEGSFDSGLWVSIIASITDRAMRNLQTYQAKWKTCHAPKDLLRGRADPEEFPIMHPTIATITMLNIGGLMVACIPASVTTMAGRRMSEVIKNKLRLKGLKTRVVIASNVNEYLLHVTTPEEYARQYYEGQVTVNGPNELNMMLNILHELHEEALVVSTCHRYEEKGLKHEDRHRVLNKNLLNAPPLNIPPKGHNFGDILTQPQPRVQQGRQVSARFVATNPRTNLRHGDSYVYVERQIQPDEWVIVARDAEWETKYFFNQANYVGTFIWDVPLTQPLGIYRFRYMGDALYTKRQYMSLTNNFKVVAARKRVE